jgi:hypothetical protein
MIERCGVKTQLIKPSIDASEHISRRLHRALAYQ